MQTQEEHPKVKRCKEIWNGPEGVQREYSVRNPAPELFAYLRETCTDFPICEVGCGSGRIAELFHPDEYVGLDINAYAVEEARKALPTHDFSVVGYEDPYPVDVDTILFHTVLLHIPDEAIESVLARCEGTNAQHAIVAETMDPIFRDGTYTFHRDRREYQNLFEAHGFLLEEERRVWMYPSKGFWDIQRYGRKETAE